MKKLSEYNCFGCIDLHIHSTASDGTFSPSEIILKANHLGLKAISITDHDTLEGSAIALESNIPNNLKLISGVEISVSPPNGFDIKGSIHILGYGIEVENYALSSCLKSLRISRKERAQKLINRLFNLGIFISKDRLYAQTNGGVVGRPHFARLMVEMGCVNSFEDAFKKFLGRGKPAYIEKEKVDISDILSMIKNAGGVPVLAHPYLVGIDNPKAFDKFILKLKSMGLMGIEVIYPNHSEYISNFYFKVACKHDLLVTGGTDFHGDNSPNLELGFGRGDFFIPDILYKNLLKIINKNY